MKSYLSFFPFSGIPCRASRSWSNSGNGKSSRPISVTSAPASRAPLAARVQRPHSMGTGGTTSVPDIWSTFLIETELAKNVKKAQLLSGSSLPAHDPVGDQIIPSLLYVRLGSILDQAFEEY